MAETLWEVSTQCRKKYKIFMYGPTGCFKTRSALRLGSGPIDQDPEVAIIDTEFGTDFYKGEFKFKVAQTTDPDEIFDAVKKLAANPGNIKTIIIDSFSVYYEAVVSKYADLFLKRENTKRAAHKVEYFSIEPKDYQIVNREVSNFVRFLLKCDLNVIVNCQVKDKWGENMQVTGTAPDAWKRLPYYFDIIIEVEQKKDIFQAKVLKDRTHHLETNKTYPWGSDIEACNLLLKAIGSLSGGVKPRAYIENPMIEPTPEIEPKKDEAPIVGPQAYDLLMQIVKLKKELRIVDQDEWNKLLTPYEVPTAKEMKIEQMQKFIGELEALRPTAAQAA
jgi:hypothetical protein